jgi:hypothetical protein
MSVCRWSRFENRERSSILLPNRQEPGYRELLNNPDGAAHLGCWLALLQQASKAGARGALVLREGWPHTAATLAKASCIPASVFESAIRALSAIGWISVAFIGRRDPEAFVRERCVLGEGLFMRTADLLADYRRWYGNASFDLSYSEPLGAEEFNRSIRAMGINYRRGRRIAGNQARTFEGIGLKIETEAARPPAVIREASL